MLLYKITITIDRIDSGRSVLSDSYKADYENTRRLIFAIDPDQVPFFTEDHQAGTKTPRPAPRKEAHP